MQSTIVDAGPLIALFDKDDHHHQAVLDSLKKQEFKLITTWPVITEVMHILRFNVNVQQNLLEWIDRGGLTIYETLQTHIQRLRVLSKKYKDLPMDLADASLVVLAEEMKTNRILSIDSDFYVYRINGKKTFKNVLNIDS